MSITFDIPALTHTLAAALQSKIDQKTKPLGALGQLEALALQIGLIQNSLTVQLQKPCLLIFAGDHGIAEAGVSAYPQSVTAQMVANFLSGGAAINVFARQHDLDLWIVDAGVNADLAPHPRLLNEKIGKGTANFLHQPAMSEEECFKAIQAGAKIVLSQDCDCIGLGEMGIGNTSSAALLMHCLLSIPLEDCVGRGTGLNDKQLQHKISILKQAIQNHQPNKNPLTVLATFGGFEIAMMVGAMLQAAALRKVILIDGFITTAALLLAFHINPRVRDYCIFSHASNEHGHQKLLYILSVKPLLQLDLRLGEGSGVALAYPLLQSAALFLNEMATFDEAGVDKN
jgi:nicotinate-nucleotide--dimethylbenzimidazole phosphoribosyltransferase